MPPNTYYCYNIYIPTEGLSLRGSLYIEGYSANNINYGWQRAVSDHITGAALKYRSLVSGIWGEWYATVFNTYIDGGSVTITSIPAGGIKDFSVSFDMDKSAQPHIVLTTRETSPDLFGLRVSGISRSGFVITVKNNKSTTSDCALEWVAVCK